ncbi:putative RNA-directed DNA polymerase [Rosa chinensis]|uniref:Putative RNA-directed DNA polymerase n=1 Tax=Rosa chinensis TaxID=74649 RepID=A0A2P6SCU2_ROSCH|nr:putative RNA-directed DNA polymerase [Rosa chinensis]
MNMTAPISIHTIIPLSGSNYKKWREDIDLYFINQSVDWVLTVAAPPALTDESSDQDKAYYKDWSRANRICRLTILKTMSDTIKGGIPDKELAGELLQAVAERFTVSEKAETSMLLGKLMTMKYNMNTNIREYIMQMINISNQLAALNMGLDEQVIITLALKSLPNQFDNLQTTYNTQKDKWSLNELIAVLVQEDERIRKNKEYTATVNLIAKPQWKFGKGKGKVSASTANTFAASSSKNPKKVVNMKKKSFKCFFCKKEGHMKRNCEAYKNWAVKKGVHKEQIAKEK